MAETATERGIVDRNINTAIAKTGLAILRHIYFQSLNILFLSQNVT